MLTLQLGEEETVALLDGDTLPGRLSAILLLVIDPAVFMRLTWSTCRRERSAQGGRTW